MVEQWSPKPQVKGSNPSSPDPTLRRPLFFIPLGGVRNQRIGPDPFLFLLWPKPYPTARAFEL